MAATLGEKFSTPPLSGLPKQIEPITTPKDLVKEGEKQCNCVSSYARRVADGRAYIYRVYGEQRATLAIIKRGKEWVIGELEAKYNRKVSMDTERMVNQWLTDQQQEQCVQ